MNRPQLIVMVGLPGSGKDYWIKNFLAKESDRDWYIASSDYYIEAIAAERGKTYSEVFDSAIKEASRRMEAGVNAAIRSGINVIWNQTNMSPGKRRGILSRFPKTYYKKAVVITSNPEIHAKRLKDRAASTGKNIPPHVLDSMRKTYAIPTIEEGFDEVVFVDNN